MKPIILLLTASILSTPLGACTSDANDQNDAGATVRIEAPNGQKFEGAATMMCNYIPNNENLMHASYFSTEQNASNGAHVGQINTIVKFTPDEVTDMKTDSSYPGFGLINKGGDPSQWYRSADIKETTFTTQGTLEAVSVTFSGTTADGAKLEASGTCKPFVTRE